MKKLLFALIVVSCMSGACTPDEPMTNRNDGEEIFSGKDFVLSPIETSVEFYVKSQDKLMYEVLEESGTCNIEAKSMHGLSVYSVHIGPNLTTKERNFVISFYRMIYDFQDGNRQEDIKNITITQSFAELDADESKELIWEYDDMVRKTIKYKSNFEVDYTFDQDYFTCSYDGETFTVVPKDKNMSAANHGTTLTMYPKVQSGSDLDQFKDNFARTYSFVHKCRDFKVDKTLLNFDADTKSTEVAVIYDGDYKLSAYDDNLLDVNKLSGNKFKVELDSKGDFSEDKTTEINVTADDGRFINIAVSIKALK